MLLARCVVEAQWSASAGAGAAQRLWCGRPGADLPRQGWLLNRVGSGDGKEMSQVRG